MRSPRRLLPLLGWCAATLTSVALASVAMLPVLRTATADESALVSVDQLRDSGEFSPPASPAPTTAAPTSPSAGPSPSRTATPAPTRSSTPPPPAKTTTTTTNKDGWTVTTDGDDRTFLRSFRVEGGQAVVRASDGVVKLVTATPSDGFAVATVQNSPDNLAVYFNEVNHSFIVHVVWKDDEPFAEVSEIGS
ncbi:DNA mismatch repair protein MutL [Actinoplanes sp. NPDC051346]|uniref:DNA mismatch repair protein MutL n=1 Tax=Actinoplanes sp. NPDC051346 TaxID=3155048 RepID=UPI0034287DFE